MEINPNPVYRHILRRILALQDKLKGRAFPAMARVKQIDVYSCGPAVLTMLFSFLGVKVSQKHIISSLRAQKKIRSLGLNMKDLARAAGFIGKGAFVFWKKPAGKISDLDAIVNRYGFPVGAEWQGVFYEDEDEDNGHYCVITEVNKASGYLRLADPYFKFAGTDRRFRIKDFLGRWWDYNEIKVAGTSRRREITDDRMMFVITPKGVSWPKKLGMARA